MAYVVKSIGNNSGKGEKHFYLYEQHRDKKSGKVVSKYIRPATNKNDKKP